MSYDSQSRVVIGWTEYIDLPEWGISNLRAKVDTGARSSALHVEDIHELPAGFVAFEVVLGRGPRKRTVRLKTRVLRRARVRSSSGHTTQRIFVSTVLRLGPIEKPIEISLINRERMIHRMLLGRSALTGSFLIDTGRRLVLGRPDRRKKKIRRRP
jgi:hypothetical protein